MEAETVEPTESYIKLLEWLHTNRKKLVIGGVTAAVIGCVWGFMSWQKSETESNADSQLMEIPLGTLENGKMVPTPATPFLDVAKTYPNTPAGEYSALLGAEALFIEGKYADAHAEFSKFIDQFPDSQLIAQAKVGIAASLEGEGKFSDSAQKYQEVISGYPTDANIVEPAKLTLARLDEQLNRVDQAMSLYEELARNQSPYDPWAGEARERGMALIMKHPELRKQQQEAAARQAGAPTRPPATGLGGITVPKPAQAPAPAADKH